ncbi:2-C-methyl-D-erythritol 4-phosphate cytidylyltransferase [Parabacteroides sp. OttesenSCG-928-N08]|nr:2-C-methyl-D-erythritol 4-phosphate cytidylyltransferase [Parabacteroides sp. OttesenSCG-928-N08]
MKRYVLIVAGGKGLRMGNDLPKQFIPIGGKPILMHTLQRFAQWDEELNIIVVLPKEMFTYWKMLCKELGCKVPHRLAVGGPTRFHSVRNGLQLIAEEVTEPEYETLAIGVHDGVRPFVTTEVIDACFTAVETEGAVVPVVPFADSIRELTPTGSHPVDRERFVAVQTPQVFRGDWLQKAYRQNYSTLFTDDASVVEAYGKAIHTVDGNSENIKITTPADLINAQAMVPKGK